MRDRRSATRRATLELLAVAGAGLGPAAHGHHSEAAFDMESMVALQGTVTEFAWRNPHVYFKLRATDASGGPVEWEIETGATPLLIRSGWSPSSLGVGERINVRAHPARDAARRYAILISLDKADGTVLQQTVANSSATAAATSIAGVWKGNLAYLADLAQGFEAMPTTPAGAAAQASFDVNSENPAARCIPYPTPATILVSGFFLTRIELGQQTVTIHNEWFDAERTVHMDGRAHPDSGERAAQGHSIGRWEGDTLVVDTARFADHRSPYQTGVPSGARKHVVERYTLSEDGRSLRVEFMLEDPEFLAAPFSGTVEWIYRPDLELFQFNCDPDVSSQYVPR
ncbi:MAG TPA: DUF6152 family protein [Gammaproteobacteria bacterium]|nr:DUF6152 family protein [Gammaproteobacteria bacterium]